VYQYAMSAGGNDPTGYYQWTSSGAVAPTQSQEIAGMRLSNGGNAADENVSEMSFWDYSSGEIDWNHMTYDDNLTDGFSSGPIYVHLCIEANSSEDALYTCVIGVPGDADYREMYGNMATFDRVDGVKITADVTGGNRTVNISNIRVKFYDYENPGHAEEIVLANGILADTTNNGKTSDHNENWVIPLTTGVWSGVEVWYEVNMSGSATFLPSPDDLLQQTRFYFIPQYP
jgi:hypothetical protein